MGDYLKTLPTDSTVSTFNELNIVNTLFTSQKNEISKMTSGIKDVILAGVLFFLLALPLIDNFLGNSLNMIKNSNILMTAAKAVIFMILFFVLQNFFLAKNAN